MNKSSLLLLPTVLGVSTSPRTKPVTRVYVKSRPENTVRHKPKNLSVDFVFSVGK
jgi:hypothetical protein